jgi:uncharacterized protein (DUF58 family)
MSATAETSAPLPGISVGLDELIALRQQARSLDIAPRCKVLATRSGGHLSRFRGRGMEYDESRVYQPGDDPRNMDWRVTARSTRPHVKLFREERERPVWLLVDIGPAMRFGTRVAFKSVVAARAAALLAWAAVDNGDRIGGLVFDGQRQYERRPAARTHGVLPLLNALAEISRPAEAGPGRSAGGLPPLASLSAAAGRLVNLVRPGSLVFVLSDFADLTAADGAWLARLGHGSEVVLVHVHDPLEMSAPPPQRYPVTDGRRQGLLDTGVAALRERWRERFADRIALLERLCRQHQAHLIGLRTDQPVGEGLKQGLRPRRQHGGAGR